MEHKSVIEMWERYRALAKETSCDINNAYTSWYFDNNEKDANELAELVLNGTKKATASLYELYEIENEELPKVGDLSIITNWDGIAQCIIQTTNIEIVPYKDVTEEFAATEGEGDKSLAYWKKAHWNYFSSEMKKIGMEPNEDMLVVCEKFEVVYK